MTLIRGASIVTLYHSDRYSDDQLRLVCRVAHALDRGLFILLESPDR